MEQIWGKSSQGQHIVYSWQMLWRRWLQGDRNATVDSLNTTVEIACHAWLSIVVYCAVFLEILALGKFFKCRSTSSSVTPCDWSHRPASSCYFSIVTMFVCVLHRFQNNRQLLLENRELFIPHNVFNAPVKDDPVGIIFPMFGAKN